MFKGGTIRVLSPLTEDGNRPKLDRNGQRMWREDFLPATAERQLVKRNHRLPDHLKKRIEPVSDGDVAAQEPVKVQEPAQPAPTKLKPGPKPKANAQTN